MAEPRSLSLQDPHLHGDDVKALQQALNRAGENVVVDGDFGTQTDAAVKAFQQKHSLLVDGIVGPVTRTALGLPSSQHMTLLKEGLYPDASDALRRIGIGAERIMQTVGSATASAGTHDAEPGEDLKVREHPENAFRIGGKTYSAAVDLRSRDMAENEIKSLLEKLGHEGFAAWNRQPGRDGWPADEVQHIHAVYAGCAMKQSLRRQVRDYLQGKNGLKSHADYTSFNPDHQSLSKVRQLFDAHNVASFAPEMEFSEEDPDVDDDHKHLEEPEPSSNECET